MESSEGVLFGLVGTCCGCNNNKLHLYGRKEAQKELVQKVQM